MAENALDIHSENVLAIRRTVIVMSVLLLSFDYRYFSLPNQLTVSQITILNITPWHIYATAIALLAYVLIKYIAKLREISAKPNGNKTPHADYWFESEKAIWKKYFHSQLLKYLDRKQAVLKKAAVGFISSHEIQRIEITAASAFQALKGGKYLCNGEGLIHYFRGSPQDLIVGIQRWQGEVGPFPVSTWRRCLMSMKAWFLYTFSDHFVIDYFPIIIALTALTKFGWLYCCRS